MKRKRNPPCRRRQLRWYLLAFLLLYMGMAVLPYLFPPTNRKDRESAPSISVIRASGQQGAILESGEEALMGRLFLIEEAREHIRLSSYLYACDESGMIIGGALLEAAQRGVQVDILVDGLIGAINFGNDPLPRALGSHPNIRIYYYNPLNLCNPQGLNARLHDKYLVADDRWLILGGRNISDEFLTAEGHPAYNSDRDVMICASPGDGESAPGQVIAYFDGLQHGEYVQPVFDQAADEEALTMRAQMAQMYEKMSVAREAWRSLCASSGFFVPVEGTRLYHNPIHPGPKEPWVWDALCGLMESAGDRCWIQSPYFVLNGAMEEQLHQALKGERDIRLFTNSLAGGNNIVALADSLWQQGRIKGLDAKLYECQGAVSQHTKCLLIDERLSVFGSFNFDMRSAYIDTEVMLLVDSASLNQRLEGKMQRIAEECLKVGQEGYVLHSGLQPLDVPFGKRMLVYLLSPLVFLIRYLV